MRLGRRERKRVRAFQDAAETLNPSDPDLAAALPPLVMDLLQTEHALVYDLTKSGETVQLRVAHGVGLEMRRLIDVTNRWFARNGFKGAYDPQLPDERQRNRAMTLADIADLTGVDRWKQLQELHPLVGLSARDQVRVLVCEGPSLLGWVGGFQADDYSAEQQAMLQAVVPSLRRRLSLGHRMGHSLLAKALESSLELINRPAFLLDSIGGVRLANRLGSGMLDARGSDTRAFLTRAITRPEECGSVRIRERGLPDHFLVVLPAGPDQASARLLEAARRWALTPRQAQVLEVLSRGHSNRRIAAELLCAETTVETHVSALLRKSGLESRSRLLASVLSLP